MTIDRYNFDYQSNYDQDKEIPQRWSDNELEIPEAPDNWSLEDFDDVLSNVGYSVH